MKLNELKAVCDSHIKIGEQRQLLEILELEISTTLADASANADLTDPKALDIISRMRVQVDLLPPRIEVLADQHKNSRVGLLIATEEFTEEVLQPKIKALRLRAVEKAEAQLAGIYSGNQLIFAVNRADQVVALDGISAGLSRDPDPGDSAQYAKRRMAVLDKLQKIEKAL